MKRIPNGIYPVMITPFTEKGEVDYAAVDAIVEYYAKCGCDGIFSVCLSSEMFELTEDERVCIAARVVKASAGRMAVVASGHISKSMDDQVRELTRMSKTGADAVVMISCLLADENEDDDVLIENMRYILKKIPDATFGMYECPRPYKRLLTEKVLRAMLATNRFAFIKDTCCDADEIAKRVSILGGNIQLFNANCATALDTFISGAAGFSGIMANYHADLFAWLYKNKDSQPDKARKLSAMLSIMSCAEGCLHPVGAKYHMNLVGVPMCLTSRTTDASAFHALNRRQIEDLVIVEGAVRQWLNA